MSKDKVFVGRIKFRSLARVGRIRGVYYGDKIKNKSKIK
jgi:ribosomal protein S14